jgi:hypothetical protein
MTARRRAGSVFVMSLLVLAGCAEEKDPHQQASPNSTTSPTTSRAPTREEAAGEAATTAVNAMLQVTDAAKANPGAKDWEPDIRRYAGDPAAFLAVKSVRDYATLGLRQEGETAVDLSVAAVDLTAPEGSTVTITGCYDSQRTKVVRVATGEFVPPATPPQYVWDITVTQYAAEPGSPWLVNVLEPLTEQPC